MMTTKKLLVLDVNGLLVDTYFYKEPLPDESPDAKVGSFYVYRRPFCEEFLQFCLENFIVGIWSSAREHNVRNLVDYVFGGTKEKLAFSWHQSDCTDLGLKSPDNQLKPLFLKELTKLWRSVKGDLPWKEGSYGPSNTLLVDDTPYKAILNPPNTAIFPRSYSARDRADNVLGHALRSYLEGICDAESVQTYVESNPFGEPSITPASPLWSYVNEIVLKVKNVLNNMGDGVAEIMSSEAVSNEGIKKDKPKSRHGEWKHHSDSLQQGDEITSEDNKAGKQTRWRNRKQKYQPAYLRSSDFDFPSEVVESQSTGLQFSDRMLQPRRSDEQLHGSDADQQVHETVNLGGQEMVAMSLNQTAWVCSQSSLSIEEQERLLEQKRSFQVREGISNLPSRLVNSSDAIQDRSFPSSELDYDGKQGHQGALEAAKPASNMQEYLNRMDKQQDNQAVHNGNNRSFDKHGNIEGLFMKFTDEGIGAERERLQKEHQDDVSGVLHGDGNASTENLHLYIGDDSLKSLEPDLMHAESYDVENFCGRLEIKDDGFVCVSNNNYASHHHSYGIRHKDRGYSEDRSKWRHDPYGGRVGNNQGWKTEERNRQDARGEMPYPKHFDERKHHFANRQKQMKYMDRHGFDKGYRNEIKHPRYFHQRWGGEPAAQPAWDASAHERRSWDQSQQDWWQSSNTETPASTNFGLLDSNFSTSQSGGPGGVRKYDEYGQGQGGNLLRHSWQHGFDQGANSFPERMEQLIVNVCGPDRFAVQAEVKGIGKRQWFDYASKEAGVSGQPYRGALRQPYQKAPSRPYWNAGACNQSYRSQHEGSRQAYHNASAYQPYHDSQDEYRQGLPSRGFSRSRQSQELRNL